MEPFFYKRIFQEIQKAQHLVFIADERIDGDSLGSSLGMADYILSLGKQVEVFVSEVIPEKYAVLPHIRICKTDANLFDDSTIDLVLTFDCSDEEYVQRFVQKIPREVLLINIDHHVTNTLFGDINQVVTDASATSEVVYQFFKINDLPLGAQAATALLCGIAFDTTIFTNEITNARAFETASHLLLCGAHIQTVVKMMFSGRSVPALRVWGLALDRLRVHPEFGFLTTFLRQQDFSESSVTEEDVKGLSDFLNLVIEAKTLFFLREKKNGGIKVSIRSRTHDVGKLSRLFGGGGHKKAAGFFVPELHLIPRKKKGWTVEKP